MRRLYLIKRANKGLALAMMAVMLPVFGLIMIFAIDLGLAHTAQTRLESAVNHAADAAVLRLPDDIGAENMAAAMVRLALADHARYGKDLNVTVAIDGNDITVTASMRANAYFGALADKNMYELAAQASRTLAP